MPKTILIASLPAPMTNWSGFLTMYPADWLEQLRQREERRRQRVIARRGKES